VLTGVKMLPTKYLSGAQKRNKRKRENQFIESQKGAIHRFFSASTNVPPKDNPKDLEEDDHDTHDQEQEQNLDEVQINQDDEDNQVIQDGDGEESFSEIFDPKTWDNLDNKRRDILIEKGPMRELNLEFPKDNLGRHFSYTFYQRKLSNSEIVDRKWLVYSKHVDKVYCFCCRLFKSNETKSLLAHAGLSDWKHLSGRLKQHENSTEHMRNMNTWNKLRSRLSKNKRIDDDLQREIAKEKERWRQVLNELILLIADTVRRYMFSIIKGAKYFSIILDCTPDKSHEEQMTLIVRCVNISSSTPRVEEFFLCFLPVDDTSGFGLFTELMDRLELLELNVEDVRGQ
ncbi:hypothetical protein ACJX0J_042240, partial [Zea mays]